MDNNENIGKAIDYFKNNKMISITKCANKFNINRQTLAKHLNILNIHEDRRKKYKIDSNFFNVIDTEEKAYWLGFLTADGCIKDNRSQLTLKISIKDIEHLEKFNNTLKYSKNISIESQSKNSFSKNKLCCVIINNKNIYNDLKKLNIYSNKTTCEKMPPAGSIPDKLINHYIRGIFDGDGWFSWSEYYSKYKNKKYKYYTAEFGIGMGKEILESIKDILERELNVSCITIKPIKSIFRYRIRSNKDIFKIMNFLYQDATIFLERKKEKYLEYCRLKTKSLKS